MPKSRPTPAALEALQSNLGQDLVESLFDEVRIEPFVAQRNQLAELADSCRVAGDEVEIAQVVTPPPAVEVAQAEPAPALPATGSSMPLAALFGMLALAGGLSMNWIQKRAL